MAMSSPGRFIFRVASILVLRGRVGPSYQVEFEQVLDFHPPQHSHEASCH